ncbi:uncharacterized protein J3D65DRAFT_666782 [Phyllosticta citribraziliensis]|uniref:Uncharacterized protein n=1 Tax=Phyllosticta citribraziliensis TaxID=989973 RepID=A0ABR1LSC6_9PEZI
MDSPEALQVPLSDSSTLRDDAETLLGDVDWTFDRAPDETIQDLNEGIDLSNPFVMIERPRKRKRDSEMEQERMTADGQTATEESRAPPMNETDKAMEQLSGCYQVGQSVIYLIWGAFALNDMRIIELAKNPP